MKRKKYNILRLTLAIPLIGLLVFISGCPQSPPRDKAKAPTFPSLWESFDKDFHQALETALKKEFRGEYAQAIENKKIASTDRIYKIDKIILLVLVILFKVVLCSII